MVYVCNTSLYYGYTRPSMSSEALSADGHQFKLELHWYNVSPQKELTRENTKTHGGIFRPGAKAMTSFFF